MIRIQKGTKDVLPSESHKWHFIEDKIRKIALDFGLKRNQNPHLRGYRAVCEGVGETTDIVNKEMYTFMDKGGRSVTLKPEGTAGAARSFIENSLDAARSPQKCIILPRCSDMSARSRED